MIVKRSASGYGATANSLLAAIERRGLTVFARVDHAAAAHEAGMELDGEQVVLFGNPRAGTPLMQRDARIGIELPLRMLVLGDDEGSQVGYHDPRRLESRYDVAELAPTLETMATLLEGLADEACAAPAAVGETR